MLKADAIDNSSWEKSKYNDPYEMKDDEVSNSEDANLFSSFNLPQMCLSSVIDIYQNKASVGAIESKNNSKDGKERLKNGERFSTARKLFEKSSVEDVGEDYFNLEPPVPAARTHIYKNCELNEDTKVQSSPVKSKPQTNVYNNEEKSIKELNEIYENEHPARDDDCEGLYYEQPWDLSCAQGDLEGRLQQFLNKALPFAKKPTSNNVLSSSHLGDFRNQEDYEKPWDLRPEKKDERGQEGYDRAWDLKAHNKDERPCGDYDLPWDKNARQIERRFRASQKANDTNDAKKNDKLNVINENNANKINSKIQPHFKASDKKSINDREMPNEYMNCETKQVKSKTSKEIPFIQGGRSSVDARVMSTSCLGIGSKPQDNYYNVQHLSKKNDDDAGSCKSRSLISLASDYNPGNYANQHIINNIHNKHPQPILHPKLSHKHPKEETKFDKKLGKKADKKLEKLDKKAVKKSDKKLEKIDKKADKKVDKKAIKEGKSSPKIVAKQKSSSKAVALAAFQIPPPPPQPPQPPQQVRSSKQDDPRSGDEYDVPWDQKIKNLLARARVEVNAKSGLEGVKNYGGVKICTHAAPPPPPAPPSLPSFDIKAPLESQDWYHGLISRTQAEDILRSHKEGSYLVRTSESNHSDYSLSVKSSKGFMHMKIVASTGANKALQYILGQFSQPFQSIPQMVVHYAHSKLPIKGAEHISLLFPVAQDFL